MLKTNSRKVNFYDLNLTTTSKEIAGAPQTSMHDFIDAISPHITKGAEISLGKYKAEITDFYWDVQNSSLHLLINKPDPELSDVAYKDLPTGKRRSGTKKPTEAIELSSHLVIEADNVTPVAQVKMTMGAGIYIGHIVVYLNSLYQATKKNSITINQIVIRPHPSGAKDSNGNPVTYESTHKIGYTAHPNTELKEILNTGFLNGIELIETAHQNFDSSAQNMITRHSIRVDTGRVKMNTHGIIQMIKTGTSKHKIQADKIKIEYEDSNGNSGSKSLNVNQLNDAFTRTAIIDLATPHSQQQTTLSQEIIDELILLG